jgi:hypothetical protein
MNFITQKAMTSGTSGLVDTKALIQAFLGKWVTLGKFARQRLGITLGTLVFVVAFVFGYREFIPERIQNSVTEVIYSNLPNAFPNSSRYTVAVAKLDGDIDNEHQKVVAAAIESVPGISLIKLKYVVYSDPTKGKVKGKRADLEKIFEASGADVIIWGEVVRAGGRSVPEVFWTSRVAPDEVVKGKRYVLQNDLQLPTQFFGDLVELVRALVDFDYANIVRSKESSQLEFRSLKRIAALLEEQDNQQTWPLDSLNRVRLRHLEAKTKILAANNESSSEDFRSLELALRKFLGSLDETQPATLKGSGLTLLSLICEHNFSLGNSETGLMDSLQFAEEAMAIVGEKDESGIYSFAIRQRAMSYQRSSAENPLGSFAGRLAYESLIAQQDYLRYAESHAAKRDAAMASYMYCRALAAYAVWRQSTYLISKSSSACRDAIRVLEGEGIYPLASNARTLLVWNESYLLSRNGKKLFSAEQLSNVRSEILRAETKRHWVDVAFHKGILASQLMRSFDETRDPRSLFEALELARDALLLTRSVDGYDSLRAGYAITLADCLYRIGRYQLSARSAEYVHAALTLNRDVKSSLPKGSDPCFLDRCVIHEEFALAPSKTLPLPEANSAISNWTSIGREHQLSAFRLPESCLVQQSCQLGYSFSGDR